MSNVYPLFKDTNKFSWEELTSISSSCVISSETWHPVVLLVQHLCVSYTLLISPVQGKLKLSLNKIVILPFLL